MLTAERYGAVVVWELGATSKKRNVQYLVDSLIYEGYKTKNHAIFLPFFTRIRSSWYLRPSPPLNLSLCQLTLLPSTPGIPAPVVPWSTSKPLRRAGGGVFLGFCGKRSSQYVAIAVCLLPRLQNCRGLRSLSSNQAALSPRCRRCLREIAMSQKPKGLCDPSTKPLSSHPPRARALRLVRSSTVALRPAARELK